MLFIKYKIKEFNDERQKNHDINDDTISYTINFYQFNRLSG